MEKPKKIDKANQNEDIQKNFSNKKISLKFLLKMILIILLLLIIIIIGRKAFVIKDLQNKISEFTDKTNYSISVNSYYGDRLSYTEYLIKDENTYLYTTGLVNEENNHKRIIFSNKEKTNEYIQTNESKIAMLNSDTSAKIEIPNYIKTDNAKDFILLLFKAKITSVKCNGKECYEIKNIENPDLVYTENGYATVYIDKETGLIERTIDRNAKNEEKDRVTDYNYEFDNVTDEDIKEPDISEYEVK